MKYRKYNPKKDKKAVHKIWLECGWIDKDKPQPMDTLLEKSRAIVADVNGSAECLVISYFGQIRHLNDDLKLSAIAAVTTSLVARKQKLAAKLTAAKIALDVADGAEMVGLGMFEQGYYDLLGFGTGSYEHFIKFAPGTLNVDVIPRVPVRLEIKDWKMIHKARMNRMLYHGSCTFPYAQATKAEMQWTKCGFGLGYKNSRGQLTHFMWIDGRGKEHGPFNVWFMAYQNYDQFLELMALLKSFGEQIHLCYMGEPPQIQFQDLLKKPFQMRNKTEKGKFENRGGIAAWWQLRICDLDKCMKKTHFDGNEVKFNLDLHDPIEKYLDSSFKWRGISGKYTITLGPKSSAKKGFTRGLPKMKTTVNAFTRMWMGVLPASSLAVTDTLEASESLKAKLDNLIRVPKPKTDWPF